VNSRFEQLRIDTPLNERIALGQVSLEIAGNLPGTAGFVWQLAPKLPA
jgi:hypothetical protein